MLLTSCKIIWKSRLECNYLTQFDNNDFIISERATTANKFNKYFRSIEPEFTKNIGTPTGISVLGYVGKRNERSMLLTPTDKEEVIRTVNSCGNRY